MYSPTIQVQSVIYQNDPANLCRTIEHLANAVRVERESVAQLGRVKLVYGDASPEPVLTEAALSELREKFGDQLDIEYRVFGFNSGSAKGHNLLAEKTEADFVMIMNPDILLSPRTLIYLMSLMDDPKTGMVEARQTPLEHPKVYDLETLETDWATTACALIRTDVFRKLNGFDCDTFFLYCDDVDFSWRVRLAGYKVRYQPNAPVYHAKHLDSEGKWMPTKSEIYYSAEASLLMAHKWSNPKLVKKLLRMFSGRSGAEREAAKAFIKRCKEGTLPEPIDPKHTVATFRDWQYSESRFVL